MPGTDTSTTSDKVADIIAEICGIGRVTITPESHIINDLGIDSLDYLDVAFAIEKTLGIRAEWDKEVNEGGYLNGANFTVAGIGQFVDKLVAAKETAT